MPEEILNQNSSIEKYFDSYSSEEIEISINDVDSKSQKERHEYFSGELNKIDTWLKHEEFRLKKINSDSERILREKNAKLAFSFSASWAVFIAIIILFKGFMFKSFKLTETEFIFIIGSLTASIFTFYLLVIKYLFYRKEE
jgi:hypothetical protein